MARIMVNGIPGSMGIIVAETALQRGHELVPFSLTGEAVADTITQVGTVPVELVKPSVRDARIVEIRNRYPDLICVDYTHPSAVNGNAEFYVRHNLPFVMGTTGGDREALLKLANAAKLPCVIAPNMAKQIVAFQAVIEHLAQSFPDSFRGYSLSIVESHQKTKADTSGTAKAIANSFRSMGLPFDDQQIEMVRTEKEQLERMAVPEAYLSGHAFHTYSLDSADHTVHFEFRHNVCGRKVYAEGTIDGVEYLQECIRRGDAPRCHSMMDILRAGAMK